MCFPTGPSGDPSLRGIQALAERTTEVSGLEEKGKNSQEFLISLSVNLRSQKGQAGPFQTIKTLEASLLAWHKSQLWTPGLRRHSVSPESFTIERGVALSLQAGRGCQEAGTVFTRWPASRWDQHLSSSFLHHMFPFHPEKEFSPTARKVLSVGCG